MMNKETLLKIFEKYKNASTGGIYMTKWDAMADEILSSQNAAKPLVRRSKPKQKDDKQTKGDSWFKSWDEAIKKM